MVIEATKGVRSTKSNIRKFGIMLGIILGLWGGLLLWRGKDISLLLLIVSLGFLFLSFFLPTMLRPIYTGWMVLAAAVGWFMTRVILSILFYLIITPIGLWGRLFGIQFLDLAIDNSRKDYWIYKRQKRINKDSYEKQY